MRPKHTHALCTVNCTPALSCATADNAVCMHGTSRHEQGKPFPNIISLCFETLACWRWYAAAGEASQSVLLLVVLLLKYRTMAPSCPCSLLLGLHSLPP